MKKLMLTILMVLVTLAGANASAFKSSILKRYATVHVSAPRDIVNPSLVVNTKTRFVFHKFDASKVSFNGMLAMAGNKTANTLNLYDSGIASRIASPVTSYQSAELDRNFKELKRLESELKSIVKK